MKIATCLSRAMTARCLTAGTLVPAPVLAQSTPSDRAPGTWEFAATIYGWVPSVGRKMAFPVDATSTSISVDPHQILDLNYNGATVGVTFRW
jgi:hypothetical protein